MSYDLPNDFDPDSYLALNPDVAKAGMDPAEHYIRYGLIEGRRYRPETNSKAALPSDFDPDLYLRINPDVEASGQDPANHYVTIGHNEGRAYKRRTQEFKTRLNINPQTLTKRRLYRSSTEGTGIEIDVEAGKIAIYIAVTLAKPSSLRIRLPEINFECEAIKSAEDVTDFFPSKDLAQVFEFRGDVVHAAIWLGKFRFTAACSEGHSFDVDGPQNLFAFLEDLRSSSRAPIPARIRGNSWLFLNREELATDPARGRVLPDDLPVYGILAAAFGDTGWYDQEGAPTADKYLDQVPPVFQAMAASGRLILLIDASNEGQALIESWMFLLHEGLSRRGIDPRYCVFLQQNRALRQQYIMWTRHNGIEPMRVLDYDYYPRRMVGYLSEEPLLIDTNCSYRKKHFCCLNYTPRPNRTSFVSWLLAKKLDRVGFLSFGSFNHFKLPPGEPAICEWFPEISSVREGLEILRAIAPLTLDLDPNSKTAPEYLLPPKAVFEESYFSIVTETEISDGNVVRVTEKSIKPLAMFHPMILVGNPHSLDLLRRYGFKTFEGFFDESYDTIEDPGSRLSAIMAEIERLVALDISQIHERYWKIWPILWFNAMHARRVLHEQFRHHLEPALIEEISHCVGLSGIGNG